MTYQLPPMLKPLRNDPGEAVLNSDIPTESEKEFERILDQMLKLAGANLIERGRREPGEKCKYEESQNVVLH